MLNPSQIENLFKEYIKNLSCLIPDGIIPISINLLHELGIIERFNEENEFMQYFHVIESAEKVTLFNEQFVVWIVPRMERETPTTFILISLNHQDNLNLEIVFSTSGVYNTPRYVLKILQHFLLDVLETEATLLSMEKSQ